MAQRIRRQQNRSKVRGVAVRKNKKKNTVQKIKKYSNRVQVVSYKKK